MSSSHRKFRRSQEKEQAPPPTGDTRYVYGFCTWHDNITNIGSTKPELVNGRGPYSLPCCPHCGSMLLEVPTEAIWWDGVKAYDKTNPGYEALLRWGKGKCFPNIGALVIAYNEATGAGFVLAAKP